MKTKPFDPKWNDLPEILPIFPLKGVLLLPGAQLPLNIYEPRYLAMVNKALSSSRMIGMVQPREEKGPAGTSPQSLHTIYQTGCAGRITSFSETDDGRYLVSLTGVLRFDIQSETLAEAGFREARLDWTRYRQDLPSERPESASADSLDRERLFDALKTYFDHLGLQCDWEALASTDDYRLLTSLAMVCPFAAEEKQALLEAANCRIRCETMISLLEMSTRFSQSTSSQHHH